MVKIKSKVLNLARLLAVREKIEKHDKLSRNFYRAVKEKKMKKAS